VTFISSISLSFRRSKMSLFVFGVLLVGVGFLVGVSLFFLFLVWFSTNKSPQTSKLSSLTCLSHSNSFHLISFLLFLSLFFSFLFFSFACLSSRLLHLLPRPSLDPHQQEG